MGLLELVHIMLPAGLQTADFETSIRISLKRNCRTDAVGCVYDVVSG